MGTKKILVIGGAGFIGHHVVRELAEKGHVVSVYDSFATYFPETKLAYQQNLQYRLAELRDKAHIVRGDLKDTALLRQTISECAPDIVIHLANIPVSSASNRFAAEAIRVNLVGTADVIEAIRHAGIQPRLLYSSSSYTYGHFQYEPVDEKHPLMPIDTYGATKVASEALIQGMGKRFGIPFTIIRPSAVYGPTGSNGAVSQLFVENALSGKPIILNNGGATRLDFTYVKDTAHGFVLAALSPKAENEIFNITRGEARSLKDLAAIIKRHIPDAEVVEKDFEEYIPKRGSLDINKARTVLGYEPNYSLEDGIAEHIDFVRTHAHDKKEKK